MRAPVMSRFSIPVAWPSQNMPGSMNSASLTTGAAHPRATRRHRAGRGLEVYMVVMCSRVKIRAWLLIGYGGTRVALI